MMFEYALRLPEEGNKIRQAVANTLQQEIVTEDISGNGKAYGTEEVGDAIARLILTDN